MQRCVSCVLLKTDLRRTSIAVVETAYFCICSLTCRSNCLIASPWLNPTECANSWISRDIRYGSASP